MGIGISDDEPDITSVAGGIEWQARHATNAGAACTGRVVRAQLKVLGSQTATGCRMANWQGNVVEDALPLRLAGGLHNLLLTGEDRRLESVYAGLVTDKELSVKYGPGGEEAVLLAASIPTASGRSGSGGSEF